MSKFHLRCSCVECKQELTVQSLKKHVSIKHLKQVRSQDRNSKYRNFLKVPTTELIQTYEIVGTISGTLRYYGITSRDPRCASHLNEVLGDFKTKLKKVPIKQQDLESRIEEIKDAAKTCSSLLCILQTLGIPRYNSHLSSKLRKILIDNSIQLVPSHEWTDELIYCKDSAFVRTTLAPRVKKDNWMEYKCSSCGNFGEWEGKELRLQIDHINGINNDHRKENLRWLCPNCHSQTETFCRMKKNRW